MKSIIGYAQILTVLYLAVTAWFWHKAEQEQAALIASVEQTTTIKDMTLSQSKMQSGFLLTKLDNQRFHSVDLPNVISLIPNKVKSISYIWADRLGNPFAYAAMGVDRNYYFANSYLVGFEPYKTRKLWQPLITLALKKTYQFDHHQYGSSWQDIWQNSQQAYFYSHGDCEDHAILLADWLISMGYDARVVIGEVSSGGHAWVILYYEGREYLLEATNKRQPRSVNDFKLAKYSPEYRPRYMFNRNSFWANVGPKLTTRYSGKHWKETANFVRSH